MESRRLHFLFSAGQASVTTFVTRGTHSFYHGQSFLVALVWLTTLTAITCAMTAVPIRLSKRTVMNSLICQHVKTHPSRTECFNMRFYQLMVDHNMLAKGFKSLPNVELQHVTWTTEEIATSNRDISTILVRRHMHGMSWTLRLGCIGWNRAHFQPKITTAVSWWWAILPRELAHASSWPLTRTRQCTADVGRTRGKR